MHEATTPPAVQAILMSVPTPGSAALIAEILELRAENQQLGRALESRAVIDQARGMVMALAPCSNERAWDLLVDVSQHCNVKLRDVAVALVATADGVTLPERIRRELHRAMRRLRALERR